MGGSSDRSWLCHLGRRGRPPLQPGQTRPRAEGLDLRRRAAPAVVEMATAKELLRLLVACGGQALEVRRKLLRGWWRQLPDCRWPAAGPAAGTLDCRSQKQPR